MGQVCLVTPAQTRKKTMVSLTMPESRRAGKDIRPRGKQRSRALSSEMHRVGKEMVRVSQEFLDEPKDLRNWILSIK
ncbi:hypothetical protein V1478_014150 [Vespula squamosa]|uniref:Uncharacterized protein n=1 Tax=Vespula squamosa TaxID=30214 RepID=A0ABD2A766_VESSQ